MPPCTLPSTVLEVQAEHSVTACQAGCTAEACVGTVQLLPETLYLTINIIDRFLEKKLVMRKKLQLVKTLSASRVVALVFLWQPDPLCLCMGVNSQGPHAMNALRAAWVYGRLHTLNHVNAEAGGACRMTQSWALLQQQACCLIVGGGDGHAGCLQI